MAFATVFGVLFGLFFGDLSKVFAPWGNAYIMILKITTVPYLIAALIHGIGQLSSAQAKEILKKGIIFIAVAWGINIAMIYFTAFLFPEFQGTPHGSYIAVEPQPINFAELLIPENIFYSLSNNIIPSVVVFAVISGICLMMLKEKQSLMSVLETSIKALTMATSWISRITPFGTFIIIANQAGSIQLSTVQQMSTYIILYILALSLVVFWIFPRLVSTLTSIPALVWLKNIFPILLLAYTTNVVIVCLPYIIALIEKETKLLDPHDEKAQNQIQGTVSIIFNLPLGSLFISVFILFVAIFYHAPLPFAANIQLLLTTFLTGLGSIGIGSWINSITFLLDSLALPLDAIDLFLTSLPFTSGFQSMVSAMEIASISLFITLACRKQMACRWTKFAWSLGITVIPLLLLFGAIKGFSPFPKFVDSSATIYDLHLRHDVNVTVYTENDKETLPRLPREDVLESILQTKVLRVGYNTHVLPFCFFNKNHELVGYDIAFAYELAHDLGCKLELVPLDYSKLNQELSEGLYDIAMSAVSVSESRLKNAAFTRFYSEGKIGFVVRDHLRKKFSSLETIKQDRALKIAVYKGSVFETLAHRIFPHHQIIPLHSYDAFASEEIADALLWAEPQAVAWALQHPRFNAVFPTPTLGMDSLGYPVSKNSIRFLNYLNDWLQLKANKGFTERNTAIWIHGEIETDQEKTPRFSILRNVLHWID
jgi:Na+/H+-dicarboxylate symporter/ABC-type amino acid transport substrate-binding protein